MNLIASPLQARAVYRPIRCAMLVLLFIAPCAFTEQQGMNTYRFHANPPLQQRIEQYSAQLLGRAYQTEALGEGPTDPYNQKPRYRFDRFDCETYVETVIALSLANNNQLNFEKIITALRYKGKPYNFTQRNHFASADWIPNNRQKGYLVDLNQRIAPTKTKLAIVTLNRRSWYQHLSLNRIQISRLADQQKQQALARLKKTGQCLASAETASIVYIPLFELFNNPECFHRIPSGSLLFLVGRDDYLEYKIGTPINVLHMGLAIRYNHTLYFRMASSNAKRIIDTPLVSYLEKYFGLNTILGISVWGVKQPP